MEIIQILSYLTYPSKRLEEQPEIGGATIPMSGRLYQMLADIFESADCECNIPICFKHDDDGAQKNPCLDELLEVISDKSVEAGRKLAKRLQSVTTRKSGMGLLFLIVGESDKEKKILISRFPADQGIIAEQSSGSLRVELIEKVFLKSAFSYKAAMYRGIPSSSDFWLGNAVDKQISNGIGDLAGYWIYDFLLSDFQTTPKAGTKRLARLLRSAVSKTGDPIVKQEIAAAATLANNLSGRALTINEFCDQFQFSEATKEAVIAGVQSERALSERFLFDVEEFAKHISYKSVELDNGAILTAAVQGFEECFEQIQNPNVPGEYTFKTHGRIVDERLKRTK